MELPETSAKVSTLGTAILNAGNVKELLSPLNDIFMVFEQEWGSTQHRRDVRDCLHDLLLFYLQRRGKPTDQGAIGSLIPNLELRRRAEMGLGRLVNLLRNNNDPEVLYLQTCLIYLLALEGVFDQTLRTLFFLAKLADGTPIKYANAHSIKLTTLQREFNKLLIISNPAPLFKGYSNNLRNSIAHTYLTYEPRMQIMAFEDHDPNTGRLTWGPVVMTYPQFKDDYYGKVEDVNVYLSCFFGMIRARDLALAKGVP